MSMRDEGTSFYYASSSDEIVVNQKYIDLFKTILGNYHYKYHIGRVWMIDGIGNKH